ncbi:hypothetical protein APY03_0530 [Variovorax sp. WDL1]|nr:hypothetical protein APY03_0530 [Variovorax sp. WDL1]
MLPGHAQVAAVLQARAGQLSAPWTLTVTNRLPMQSLAIAGAAATPGFSLGDSSCAVLLPGESCSVAVRFQSSAQLPSTPGRVRLEFRQELEGLPTGGMSALSVTLYGEQVR